MDYILFIKCAFNVFCFFHFSILFTRDSRMLRASVCPSVCLCVCYTLEPYKTVQARITKSSLWVAARTLVFSDKISCSWVMWFLLN